MNLDDRMKGYENSWRIKVPPRQPVIIRLDGKAFHTLTENCRKPFDGNLRESILQGVFNLRKEVPFRLAYCQSDEVSLLLIDYNKFDSQQWFDGNIQKMTSVAASMMSVGFTQDWYRRQNGAPPGYFDARVFAVPERDIENYFVWRQRDCMRNALSMVAQAHYSHKALMFMNDKEKTTMLKEKGVTFDQFPDFWRYGTIVTKDGETDAAPEFSKRTSYLKRFLKVEEE